MTTRFTVIGDGAMGTACAILLAKEPDHEVTIWCQFDENRKEMEAARENRKFLPGVPIPSSIRFVNDFSIAAQADAFILAVPTVYLSSTLERIKSLYPQDKPMASVVKGVERGTFRRPTEIVSNVIGDVPLAVLTGPSHAEEIARGLPASVLAASRDMELANRVQQWFTRGHFRVYTSTDLLGAELGGALKNVIAVAAGICDGLGFGDNAKSALMTRGLVEMTRFAIAQGAKEQTFYGLAGLGDLITTCVSAHGRNRKVGEMIGQGLTLDQILQRMHQVAEGVWTSQSVYEYCQSKNIEMPVSTEVYRILFEKKNPRQAVDDLFNRTPIAERHSTK